MRRSGDRTAPARRRGASAPMCGGSTVTVRAVASANASTRPPRFAARTNSEAARAYGRRDVHGDADERDDDEERRASDGIASNVACYTERNLDLRSDRSRRSIRRSSRARSNPNIRTSNDRIDPNRNRHEKADHRDRRPVGRGQGHDRAHARRALGYRHIDTGAMYRAVGWKADARRHRRWTTRPRWRRSRARGAVVVEGGVVSIDGHDVTRAIRTPEIDKAAAAVARLPRVREVLVARQRALGEDGGVVMEGRDIGTVVFPNADVKIYLDASAEERARRRANDPAHTGSQAGQAAVAAAIEARDESDTTRTGLAADARAGRGPHRHDGHADRSRRRYGDGARPSAFVVVVRRRRVELPAVLVAVADLLLALQLFVVLVLDAERAADVVDDRPGRASGCRLPAPRRPRCRPTPSRRRRRRPSAPGWSRCARGTCPRAPAVPTERPMP